MEPESSLPHSQQPATCPYPEQLHIHIQLKYTNHNYTVLEGKIEHAVAQLVEALRYKAEGRGFDWYFFY
jgi:hypothetical protein